MQMAACQKTTCAIKLSVFDLRPKSFSSLNSIFERKRRKSSTIHAMPSASILVYLYTVSIWNDNVLSRFQGTAPTSSVSNEHFREREEARGGKDIYHFAHRFWFQTMMTVEVGSSSLARFEEVFILPPPQKNMAYIALGLVHMYL
jgi:choline dehydrogenase-like flavoprotein